METLLVYPEKKKDLQAVKTFLNELNVKFEAKKETYNLDFVNKITESREEIAQGKGKKIDIKDLWK